MAAKIKKNPDYESFLVEELKDSKFAVAYLNEALAEADEGSEERFLIALRHVAQAHGMTAVSDRAGMARQAMYRALSPKGNPELTSLRAVLSALGLRLSVQSKRRSRAS